MPSLCSVEGGQVENRKLSVSARPVPVPCQPACCLWRASRVPTTKALDLVAGQGPRPSAHAYRLLPAPRLKSCSHELATHSQLASRGRIALPWAWHLELAARPVPCLAPRLAARLPASPSFTTARCAHRPRAPRAAAGVARVERRAAQGVVPLFAGEQVSWKAQRL